MKTAMFVLAIIELVFLMLIYIFHNIKIDINNTDLKYDFNSIFVIGVLVLVSIGLSVLAIISRFI